MHKKNRKSCMLIMEYDVIMTRCTLKHTNPVQEFRQTFKAVFILHTYTCIYSSFSMKIIIEMFNKLII